MNIAAPLSPAQTSLVAALTGAAGNPQTPVASPASSFLSVMHLFTLSAGSAPTAVGEEAGVVPESGNGSADSFSYKAAAPETVADGIIRAMLGTLPAGTASAAATSTLPGPGDSSVETWAGRILSTAASLPRATPMSAALTNPGHAGPTSPTDPESASSSGSPVALAADAADLSCGDALGSADNGWPDAPLPGISANLPNSKASLKRPAGNPVSPPFPMGLPVPLAPPEPPVAMAAGASSGPAARMPASRGSVSQAGAGPAGIRGISPAAASGDPEGARAPLPVSPVASTRGALSFGATITPKEGTGQKEGTAQTAASASASEGAGGTEDDPPSGDSAQNPNADAAQMPVDEPPAPGSGKAATPGTTAAAPAVLTIAGGIGNAPAAAASGPGFSTAPEALAQAADAPAPPHATALAPDTPASAAQQMTLRVAPSTGDASGAVDIRVIQRAGQMQVTVHTPDAALEANLRQDLPELVHGLDQAGFSVQTFVPRISDVTTAGASSFGFSASDAASSGGASGSSSGNAKDANGGQSGQSFSGQAFSGQNSSGNSARDRESERWLKQMEE